MENGYENRTNCLLFLSAEHQKVAEQINYLSRGTKRTSCVLPAAQLRGRINQLAFLKELVQTSASVTPVVGLVMLIVRMETQERQPGKRSEVVSTVTYVIIRYVLIFHVLRFFVRRRNVTASSGTTISTDFATLACSEILSKILIRCVTRH